MYAIIQTGGKQEKVVVGDVVSVERIDNKKSVTFHDVLLVADGEKIIVGTPHVKGAKVAAEIVEEFRTPKVIAFTYRRRKSSRRIHGHRQTMTRVKITDISVSST
jgi:large subunit ribosomal protein L21